MYSTIARTIALTLTTVGIATVIGTINNTPAVASGCRIFPCGALTNNTDNDWIYVKWTDNDRDWKYDNVRPGHTKGGWWNDGIDVDYFYIPTTCHAFGGIGGTAKTWFSGWHKISSDETVVIDEISCREIQI